MSGQAWTLRNRLPTPAPAPLFAVLVGILIGLVVLTPRLAVVATVVVVMSCLVLSLSAVSPRRRWKLASDLDGYEESSTRFSPLVVRAWTTTVVALIPVTFLSGSPWVLGFRPSGLAWIFLLVVTVFVLLARPPGRTMLRYGIPFIAYVAFALMSLAWSPAPRVGLQSVAQFATVLAVYAVGMSMGSAKSRQIPRLRRVAQLGLFIAAGLAIAPVVAPSVPNLTGSATRSLAIAAVCLYVFATLGQRSWSIDLAVGGLAIATCLVTGSRTASVVVVAMLFISAALRQNTVRLLVLSAVLALSGIALVNTTAFQERMFHSSEGSIGDVLSMNPNFDTSGRAEIWGELAGRCSESPWWGTGFGSADLYTEEFTSGILSQPHNDYLRTYCDTGAVGTIVFWSFILAVIYRGIRFFFGGPRLPGRGAWPVASIQLAVAILLFALSDNVLIYTAQFMAPAALAFSGSDGLFARWSGDPA